MADVHVRTLRRAAEIAGGEQQLSYLLKVTPSHLALWLAGVEVPPGYIFLRAVDMVTEHDLAKLSSTPPEGQKPPDDPSNFLRRPADAG